MGGHTLQLGGVGSAVPGQGLPGKLALGAVGTFRAAVDVYGELPDEGCCQSYCLREGGPVPSVLLPVGLRLPHLRRSELSLKCRECDIHVSIDLPETEIETCECACTGDAIDGETPNKSLGDQFFETLTQGKEPSRVSIRLATNGPIKSGLITVLTAYRQVFAAATELVLDASEDAAALLRPHAKRLPKVHTVTLLPHRPPGSGRQAVLMVPAQLLAALPLLQRVCVQAADVSSVGKIVRQCVKGREVEVLDGGAVCALPPLHSTLVMASLCG